MREELARQHAHESELRENRGHMVSGGHSSGPAVPERSAAMAFMEQVLSDHKPNPTPNPNPDPDPKPDPDPNPNPNRSPNPHPHPHRSPLTAHRSPLTAHLAPYP